MIDQTETSYLVTYDANWNVVALVNAGTMEAQAQYEYDAFGNTVVGVGDTDLSPFRFSTKYQDTLTGLYYYGYRYYNPDTGRWLSRDPIGEEGGLNLYGMVNNDPVKRWDYLGLRNDEYDPCNKCPEDPGSELTKRQAKEFLKQLPGIGPIVDKLDTAKSSADALADVACACKKFQKGGGDHFDEFFDCKECCDAIFKALSPQGDWLQQCVGACPGMYGT